MISAVTAEKNFHFKYTPKHARNPTHTNGFTFPGHASGERPVQTQTNQVYQAQRLRRSHGEVPQGKYQDHCYHIPLRLSLKKTAHKDVSLEKALPRKRFTRNRTPSNAPSIVRLEAEPALVTEVRQQEGRPEQVPAVESDRQRNKQKPESLHPEESFGKKPGYL